MRREKIAASATAIVVLLTGSRCAAVQSHPSQGHAASQIVLSTPIIHSAQPDSVAIPYGGVVEVTLHGAGFVPGQPGQNTVHFDGTALRQVAGSADGQRIVFVIPEFMRSGGESPPARLQAGSYNVSVETATGTSNAVTIRVYR